MLALLWAWVTGLAVIGLLSCVFAYRPLLFPRFARACFALWAFCGLFAMVVSTVGGHR